MWLVYINEKKPFVMVGEKYTHVQLDIQGSVNKKKKSPKPQILLSQCRSVMDTRTRSDNLLPEPCKVVKLLSKPTGTLLATPFVFCWNQEFRPAGFKAYNKDAEIWKSRCFPVGNLTQKIMKNKNQRAEPEEWA